MSYDLQKASTLKRFSAWLLDAILFCVLATGCIWAISDLIGYQAQAEQLDGYYKQYEEKYNVSFTDDQETLDAMTEAEKEAYLATRDEAYSAMSQDPDVMRTFNLVVQMILLMLGIGVFIAKLLLEFLIPLWLRNGQTIGKKVFGLALMRTNGVRINGVSLFIRSILGKYTIETMIPVFIIIMVLTNVLGMLGLILILVLVVVQIGMMIATPTNAMIHDKLADTVVVDMASQQIFDTVDDRVAYQQRLAAERADQQTY